jgi:hypothetical protein
MKMDTKPVGGSKKRRDPDKFLTKKLQDPALSNFTQQMTRLVTGEEKIYDAVNGQDT